MVQKIRADRQFGLGQAFNSEFRIWLCCLIKQSYPETHTEPVTLLIEKADGRPSPSQTQLPRNSDFVKSTSEREAAHVRLFFSSPPRN